MILSHEVKDDNYRVRQIHQTRSLDAESMTLLAQRAKPNTREGSQILVATENCRFISHIKLNILFISFICKKQTLSFFSCGLPFFVSALI